MQNSSHNLPQLTARPYAHLFGIIFLIVALGSCEAKKPIPADAADLVLHSGKIYTVNDAKPWAQSVAVRGGKIIAIGSDNEVAELISDATELVNLGGRMAMPGIVDIHLHPTTGAMAELFDCSFPFTSSVDEILQKVATCAQDAPAGQWVRGGQWPVSLLADKTAITAAMLDAVTPDNPVLLMDSTVHNAWVNSAALLILGIDENSADPPGGRVVRFADGQPTGVLVDDAAYDAMPVLPDYTLQQYQSAIRWTVENLHEFGVTAFMDAIAEAGSLEAYAELDRAGQLNMRVAAALIWKRSWSQPEKQHRENIEQRDKYRTEHVNPDFIKIFLDGIPLTRTAYLLESYATAMDGVPPHRGSPLHSDDELNNDIVDFDRRGMTVKMHAVGDAALRQGLNAIAAARMHNGESGLPHQIGHAGLIHSADIPRFSRLSAIPEMSPIMWYPIPGVFAGQIAAVGEERAMHAYPIKSLVESGAEPAYGSDWPAIVPDPNPWPGLEAMVTRRNPYLDAPQQARWEDEAVDLATAIKIFTLNGAKALNLSEDTGSLEVGKSADIIVLSQNVFEIPAVNIAETKVALTFFQGQLVHEDNR